MPSPSQLFLPTVLVASPLLLAATQPTDPSSLQQPSCAFSEITASPTTAAGSSLEEDNWVSIDITNSFEVPPNSTPASLLERETVSGNPTPNPQNYIVHPVVTPLQALITSQQEWLAFDDEPTQAQNRCNSKEEPGAPPAAGTTEAPSSELPDLSPGAGTQSPSPAPSPAATPAPSSPAPAETTPAETSAPEITPQETTPTTSDSSETIPTETTPSPVLTSPVLRERETPPPPSDPAIDPNNFTPEAEAPTPFDGSVVTTLESLPDGSYRYLSGNFEYGNYTDEQLIANGGSVFLLTKVGNEVAGNLLPRLDLPGICVTGTVSGDTITGSAYPDENIIDTDTSVDADTDADTDTDTDADATETETDAETDAETKERVREIGDTFEPYGSGALQIRQSRTVGDRTYYQGAVLDLSNFSRINAGSAIAPTECNVPTEKTDADE